MLRRVPTALVVVICLVCVLATGLVAFGSQRGLVAKVTDLESRLAEKEKALLSVQKENEALRSAAQKPATRPISMLYVSFPYKVRFVENELGAHLLPQEESAVLRTIPAGTVVKVNDVVGVNGQLWLHVTIPVYDGPMNVKGWVQQKETVPYTRDKVSQVRCELTVAAGSPFFEGFDFSRISPANMEVASHLERGMLGERRNGYTRLVTPGGRDIWVEDKYVIYPPPDDAPSVPWTER